MKKGTNPIFEKYYKRLMVEGFLRSLLCGFVVGFAVNFVAATVFWAFDITPFWLTIVIGVGVGILCSVLFYFKLFQPDTKLIARRIDRLGLEERLITMAELENDDSYIALKQREDAKMKLSSVNIKSIKYKVSTAVIIACSVAFVMGSSMTVVAGLSESGVIKKGSEIIDDVLPEEKKEYVEIQYNIEMDMGGYIEGDAIQVIEKGGDATMVIAVPDEGFAFVNWSDGLKNPTRTDLNVTEDRVLVAVFLPLEQGDGDGDGMGQPTEGEPPPDAEPQHKEENLPPSDQHSQGASGKYEEKNMIIDGKTYYLDIYESDYYAKAMEALAANQELSPELREFIETYMGILLS